MKFPKTIYVTIGNEDEAEENQFLSVDEIETIDEDGKRCAVYELKAVGIVSVSRAFTTEKGESK